GLSCRAGAVAVFGRAGTTASTGRLAWGGVVFGFGGAIKVWAIVPVLVIVVLCLSRPRASRPPPLRLPHVRRAALFAGGVAAGFLIPVLPVLVAFPGRLDRHGGGAQRRRSG